MKRRGRSNVRRPRSSRSPPTRPPPPAPASESGPRRAVHLSRHKWPGESWSRRGHLLSSQPLSAARLSYPWSPFPPRRARPGPGPHRLRGLLLDEAHVLGLCLGACGGPGGVAVSYKRGTPVCVRARARPLRRVRTGSGTGPPRGKRAPRVGISSTVFGVLVDISEPYSTLPGGSRVRRV